MSDHYFSADPNSVEQRSRIDVSVWGVGLSLETSTGVFASGRLDIGTSVLFRETKPPLHGGSYLDLGCGYGVIALALASTVANSAVTAVDVNERAVRLTRDNARALGLDQVTACLPEEVPETAEFDEIWSNPPIRIGKEALHDLLLQWLPRLATGGRAVLVVGKNLGADSLQRWLVEQGYPCKRLASAKGFRVFEVRSAT